MIKRLVIITSNSFKINWLSSRHTNTTGLGIRAKLMLVGALQERIQIFLWGGGAGWGGGRGSGEGVQAHFPKILAFYPGEW